MESTSKTTVFRWLALATVLAAAASSAWAQCTASCFEKRWSLALDLQGNGKPDPGDVLQYEITFCTSTGGSCTVIDNVDVLNRSVTDLTLVNDPQRPAGPMIECFENNHGQSTVCRAAPTGVSIGTCSADSISDTATVSAGRMPPDGCFTFRIWAEISGNLVPPFPLLCNQANSNNDVSDDPGTPAVGDPTCVNLGLNPGTIERSTRNTSFTDSCPANPSFPGAGNGQISPGEELVLTLGIENTGGTDIPASPPPFTGTIESGPGYTILAGSSPYTTTVQPNILLRNSANHGTNSQPLRVRISPTQACPSTVNLQFRVDNATGGPYSVVFPFLVDDCRVCATPPADIATTKALNPPGQTGTVGQPVRFRITVRNLGPGTFTSGQVSDMLDASGCLTLLDCSKVTCDPGTSGATCGTCTMVGNGFTYTFSNLPQGQTITFDVEATAAANTASCGNTATVIDGVTGDNNDTGSATVCIGPGCVPVPEYTVTKTPVPPSVGQGATAQYTITIDNIGTVNLTGCTFTDNVNAPGCASLTRCDGSSPTIPVTCNIAAGTLSSGAPFGVPAGQKQTVLFTVTAGNTPGLCPNTVNVSCQTGGDRVGQGAIDISGASYTVDKAASPATASPGQTAQFTITITNMGAADITGCTFTDNVNGPGCMSLTSCDGSSPTIPITCNIPGGTISSGAPFSVGLGGGQQTVTFTVTAGSTTGPCTNTVSVSCQNGGDAVGQGVLTIGAPCSLMTNNPPITFPPVNPARVGQWVYTSSCQGLTQSILVSPANGLTVEPVGNTPGNLDLYTLDCPCAASDICFVKDSTTRTNVVFYNCQ